MKTFPRPSFLAAVLAVLIPQVRADLKVHEWGTFTILEGTDGVALEWYQAEPLLVELPDFAKRPVNPALAATIPRVVGDQSLTKSGVGSLVLSEIFIPQAHANLKVHEWGTFRILGTDGVVLEMYQAKPQSGELPDQGLKSGWYPSSVAQRLVRSGELPDQSLKSGAKSLVLSESVPGNGRPAKIAGVEVAGKSGTANFWRRAGGTVGTGSATRMDKVRMETPVLYFYPDKTMDITVEASLTGGRITEVFPPATTTDGTTTWHGTLFPATSDERALVPAANGPRARQYAAARQVPEAWLFKGQPVAGVEASVKAVEPVEHFIFYRGAGSRPQFEISAVPSEDGNALTVTNNWSAGMPWVLALRVENGKSSWTVQEQLATGPKNQRTLAFPVSNGPAKEVAVQLRQVMTKALTRQGLTPSEAAAMVATWDDLWFTDPGTRLLVVLPQSFADAMVPLKITPQPVETLRVYVGRVELFSSKQEAALVALLSEPDATQDRAAARRRLHELHLGRYAAGGLERASALMTAAMHTKRQAQGR